MFTRLTYLYRDAGNYKQFGDLLLGGCISDEHWRWLLSRCDSGCLFVAEQVGIPSLADRLQDEFGGADADDHGWHELVGAMPVTTQTEDREVWGTVDALIARFEKVSVWTVATSEPV